MSRWTKVGLVCIGYALAFVAAAVASHLYDARVSALPYDTSGGMYAGGQFMAASAAFLVVALVPTLMALWFLRTNRTLWQGVAIGSLAFAITGLLAVLKPLVARDQPTHVVAMLVDLLGLAQLLGVPLWTLAFALFAVLAQTPSARRMLVVAVGLELVIGACALTHWFVPGSPL